MFTTLISADELKARLQACIVIDCRFDLSAPEAGRAAYLQAHIPGALYAHLDTDLSGPKTADAGRHPLPDPAQLATTFGRFGITASSQVIAYDADNGMFAARLWWLLRWLGHRAVAVLDGGIKAWTQASHPIDHDPATTAVTTFVGRTFIGNPQAHMLAEAVAVAACASLSDRRVLDARAPERFRGDIEPIDPVAGHIPGARNHPFAWNLDHDARWLPASELARKLRTSLDGVAAEHAIVMCGSGVAACHNLLALEVADLPGAKLYAGSWSEWIRDPTRPVTKG